MVVMRKCVARYPALCTQEGGGLTFPMTAPGSKAASGPIETRRGGTSGKWAGLDTSRAPLPGQTTLDNNNDSFPSFLEKATAHMFLPFPPFGPSGWRGLSCPDRTVSPKMIATPNHDRRHLVKVKPMMSPSLKQMVTVTDRRVITDLHSLASLPFACTGGWGR